MERKNIYIILSLLVTIIAAFIGIIPFIYSNFFQKDHKIMPIKIPLGIYRQTFVEPKGLGECPQCTITISERSSDRIHIESNNGWYGDATFDPTSETYKGTSEWLKGKGGHYDGVVSNITVFYSNDTVSIDFSNEKVSTLIQVTYQKVK
jgi:hypothetical protein